MYVCMYVCMYAFIYALLYRSSNRLTSVDLPELSLLPRLRHLDLSGNRLVTLTQLSFMPTLTSLSVAHNEIRSLSGIEDSVAHIQVYAGKGAYTHTYIHTCAEYIK